MHFDGSKQCRRFVLVDNAWEKVNGKLEGFCLFLNIL